MQLGHLSIHRPQHKKLYYFCPRHVKYMIAFTRFFTRSPVLFLQQDNDTDGLHKRNSLSTGSKLLGVVVQAVCEDKEMCIFDQYLSRVYSSRFSAHHIPQSGYVEFAGGIEQLFQCAAGPSYLLPQKPLIRI